MARGKQNSKLEQVWMPEYLRNAIAVYCTKVDRNKSDAYRILLKKALELEGVLREVQG